MLPFELTKDTPYLALSGELWSVFYEYFNINWSCYKGFLLYDYLCGDLGSASNSGDLDLINLLSLNQDVSGSTDDNFKGIYLNENIWIVIKFR